MKFVFSIIVFLTVCCGLAQADPITFNLTAATIGGIAYTPAQANGQWIYLEGYRIKLVASGMPDSADPESVGIFWAAMTTPFTLSQSFTVALTGTVCVDGSCADTTIIGAIETSADGMRWKLPPPPATIKGNDGRVFTLSPVTNLPGNGRTWTSTIDVNLTGFIAPTIAGDPVPVGEPTFLALGGMLLLGIRRCLRKKKGHDA